MSVNQRESHIAWLASFPKSGNTWLRALLDALEHEGQVDINRLSVGQVDNALDSIPLCSLSDLDPQQTMQMFRGVRAFLQPGGGRHYVRMKTHDAYVPEVDGVPRCWQPEGAVAIYLVRDPRAVAVSYAHHMGAPQEPIVRAMGNEEFTSGPLNITYTRSVFSSWSENVRSWTRQTDIPTLVMRYEDLIDDTHTSLERVARWLQMPCDSDQIDAAVSACTFEQLALHEMVNGFTEAISDERAFFRRGEAQAWREELAPELQRRIEADHGPVMEEFGYL